MIRHVDQGAFVTSQQSSSASGSQRRLLSQALSSTPVGGAMSEDHDLAALCGERSLGQFENVLPHFRLFTALVATRELRTVKKL